MQVKINVVVDMKTWLLVFDANAMSKHGIKIIIKTINKTQETYFEADQYKRNQKC